MGAAIDINKLIKHLEFLTVCNNNIKEGQTIGDSQATAILLTCELIADRMRYYILRREQS
ncbi:MAG: hypothetical protein ABIK15_07160 [Pseudomonadota bacterium]